MTGVVTGTVGDVVMCCYVVCCSDDRMELEL